MNNVVEQQVKTKKETGFRLRPENINRLGRPTNPEKKVLEGALRAMKHKHGNVDFLHHIADMAYTDKGVALAVLDKLIPDATLPKDADEQKEQPKFVLVFNDGSTYGNQNHIKAVPAEVYSKSEEVSGDVVVMGNGKDDVSDSQGHDLHRASEQQSGGDLPQGVHRPQELNGSGLREVLGLQGGQQPNGHEPENEV